MVAPTRENILVARRGTDTSGRGIFMSGWMWLCWRALLNDPRLAAFRDKIIVVQGPWMDKNGGGAADSAGFHDEGGCDDIRTWNLTTAELDLFIWVASEYGFQFWRRDPSPAHGGMDSHAHCVFGSDFNLTSGARQQVAALRATPRKDGLAGNGPDYEKRFTPIRFEPPTELLQEDYMATSAAENKLDQLLEAVKGIDTDLGKLSDDERRRFQEERKRAKQRYSKLITKLGDLADDLGGDARAKVLKILADEPDVDGADNPAQEA
jgi:hypothetical protein